MISPALCRAARNYFGWDRPELGRRCGYSWHSIRGYERGKVGGRSNMVLAIEAVFEEEGCEFTRMEGVEILSVTLKGQSSPPRNE